LNLSPEKQQNWFNEKQSGWNRFWQRLGFSAPPDLTGKRLLDVGSGLGGNTAAAARAGAQVVSLEPDTEVHQVAISLVNQELAELTKNVEFVKGTIESYSDTDGFDYILCDEVFEHLLDFPTAIAAMANLLRPNGKLVSGWGPLWHSPVGGHQLMLYAVPSGKRKFIPTITLKSLSAGMSGRRIIPYSHRLFTNYALRLHRESQQVSDINSLQQVGMNGYSVRQFRDAIDKSPLNVIRWESNQGEHAAYKILRSLNKFPGTKNLFTSNIYAVFELAPQSDGSTD